MTCHATCDKCGDHHPTERCPWFRAANGSARQRQNHPDAVPLPVEDRPPLLPDAPPIECRGKVEVQPGDGSCMYHPLRRGERAIGLPGGTALALRQRLAAFVKANPGRRIAGKSLTAWLKLERGGGITMDAYARRQAQSGWGGSLELLAYMLSEKRDVWIWVPQRGGLFRRTTTFELPAGQAKDRVDLCYIQGQHSLRLVPAERPRADCRFSAEAQPWAAGVCAISSGCSFAIALVRQRDGVQVGGSWI